VSAKDKNGVALREGMRVIDEREREGTVLSHVGPYRVYVLWDGETDDELESAERLTIVSEVHYVRRRRG